MLPSFQVSAIDIFAYSKESYGSVMISFAEISKSFKANRLKLTKINALVFMAAHSFHKIVGALEFEVQHYPSRVCTCKKSRNTSNSNPKTA
jgi:hypothetical protein